MRAVMRVNTTAAVTQWNQKLPYMVKHLFFPFAAFEAYKFYMVIMIPFDIEYLTLCAPDIEAIWQIDRRTNTCRIAFSQNNFIERWEFLEWRVMRYFKFVSFPYQ